jgi:hypothetical protein
MSKCATIEWGCVIVVLAGCSSKPPEDPAVPVAPALETQAETATIAEAAPAFDVEDGFRLLALADFASFPADADSWREEGGELICTGTPKGYIYSKEPFGNFTLRGEYRFEPPTADAAADAPPPNTGFMLAIQEPHKIWPASLEVQGKHTEMCAIKSNGGIPDLVVQDDPDAREMARNPVGEWNSVEIVMQDGAATATLNGTQICTSEPGEVREGFIGLQAEGFEVRFRNLRIRPNDFD